MDLSHRSLKEYIMSRVATALSSPFSMFGRVANSLSEFRREYSQSGASWE